MTNFFKRILLNSLCFSLLFSQNIFISEATGDKVVQSSAEEVASLQPSGNNGKSPSPQSGASASGVESKSASSVSRVKRSNGAQVKNISGVTTGGVNKAEFTRKTGQIAKLICFDLNNYGSLYNNIIANKSTSSLHAIYSLYQFFKRLRYYALHRNNKKMVSKILYAQNSFNNLDKSVGFTWDKATFDNLDDTKYNKIMSELYTLHDLLIEIARQHAPDFNYNETSLYKDNKGRYVKN